MREFTLTAWKLSDFKGAISGDGFDRADPPPDADVIRPVEPTDDAAQSEPAEPRTLEEESKQPSDGSKSAEPMAPAAEPGRDEVVTGDGPPPETAKDGTVRSGTETQGDSFVGTEATLSGDAAQVKFQVKDDDGFLEDAYIETGALSVLSQDLVIDGVTYPAGKTHIEAEFQLVTTDTPPITFTIARLGTGSSNSGENLLVFTDAPIKPGQSFKFASTSDKAALPYGTICFCAETLVATPGGMRRIGSLAAGDAVLTRDSGVRVIRWIGRRRFGPGDLLVRPSLAPVRIRAGALGGGRPAHDLLVSPQHRMLMEGWRAQCLFAEAEVLAPAIGLLGAPGVARAGPGRAITYVHLLLDGHELIWANGAWSETLLTGPMARRTMSAEALAELGAIFPGVVAAAADPARPLLSAREARALATPGLVRAG